jgi:hypothetical protein
MNLPPGDTVVGLSIGEQLVNCAIRLSIVGKEATTAAKAVVDRYAESSGDEAERVVLQKLSALVTEASTMLDPPYIKERAAAASQPAPTGIFGDPGTGAHSDFIPDPTEGRF